MLAAQFKAPGQLGLVRLPRPEIRKDSEALIRVEAAGICGTDLQILKQPPGHPAGPGVILGHEFVGTVEKTGLAGSPVKNGDRVVIDPNISCGVCPACRNGRPNACPEMTTLGIFIDGGFAPYAVAPVSSLHKISADVPVERAVLAEPLSCILNAYRKVEHQPGEAVVILGAGPIGIMFALLFTAGGAGRVVLTDISSSRLETARRICPSAAVVDPAAADPAGFLAGGSGLPGADIVVDAAGCLFAEAVRICRPGGSILLFGQDKTACAGITQNDITRRELKVIGSYIACHTFSAAVRLLESGLLPLEKMITHRVPLAEIEKGFAVLQEGEALKVLVDIR